MTNGDVFLEGKKETADVTIIIELCPPKTPIDVIIPSTLEM